MFFVDEEDFHKPLHFLKPWMWSMMHSNVSF